MLILRELKRSYHSLFIYRLRTFLSTLGILFGVVSVIAMLSIGEGAKQETLQQIEQLGMNNIIIRQPLQSDKQRTKASEKHSKGLSWEDVNALHNNIPFLLYDAPLKVVKASLTSSLPHLSPEILAITRHYGEMKELQLMEGRFLCDLDQQRKKLVCVIGYDIAKNLGQEGHVGQILQIEKSDYEIVGVLKSISWKASKNQLLSTRNLDKSILIPLCPDISLPHSSITSNDALSEIILQIQDSQYMKMSIQLVTNILQRLHGGYEDYQIVIPQELLDQASRTQKTFNWVLGSLAAISLLIGGIGIMNIMLATVSERTREIGIRRAVGASQQHILMQFLLETFLLTLVGALLGVLIGIGLSIAISTIAGWKTIVTFGSIILALVMACLIGICSGLYPAFQAAKMDPIKALYHN